VCQQRYGRIDRVEIWYNPACSKCVASEELLAAAGVPYAERRYLDDPPTPHEIERVLDLLGIEPWDLTRMDEPRAVELGLVTAPRDRTEWVRVLAANPVLIQRPVVITDDGHAVIGRPPERILDLL
jgi:arsenate reductase